MSHSINLIIKPLKSLFLLMNKILTALALLVPYTINGIIISFVNPVYPLLA